MANLVDHNPITTTGDYELPRLIPGAKYLLCVKSATSYSAYLSYWDQAANTYQACNDGGFYPGEGSEKTFIAPCQKMQLFVDGIVGNISVTLTQILN